MVSHSTKEAQELKETSVANQPIVLNSQSIDIKGSTSLTELKALPEPENFDSLEPIKPPRLKKMARLQKQQQELKYQNSKQELEQHLSQKLLKIAKPQILNSGENSIDDCSANYGSGGFLGKRNGNHRVSAISNVSDSSVAKPQISNPVLVASTLNPNDVEGHRSLSTFNPSDVLSHFEHLNANKKLRKSDQKITFKDLKRYASTSFASLNTSFASLRSNETAGAKRASFYEADREQDSIYEDPTTKPKSPTYSEHIYEEIPERIKEEQRPLPPIPEGAANADQKGSKPSRVSIFEGASKYEILHYLKDAKDRIGHGDFEIDLDQNSTDDYSANYGSTGFLGKRNANHRVSAISNVSDSSDDSGIQHRFKLKVGAEIERTDSGVGSETSKSSKSSVELRRAPSLSKSSDSGSGSGQDVLTCPDCDSELELNENICKRCSKRRSERKEIITEIAETEAKYGRDLRIIVEEFYR